jgi:class 3 adenylate cyclase/tetratricopeptide (TPR) repeat protein
LSATREQAASAAEAASLPEVTGRRSAVIVFLDMVGYSALTQRDEVLALRLLDEMRVHVRARCARWKGQEIKTIGDAFLLEFESALDSVRCSLDIQRGLAERNQRSPDAKIQLRIGIHSGEVVHRERDVFGDTVNVASRLVPLARPGGLCVSGPVFDRVRGLTDIRWMPLARTGLRGMDTAPELYQLELPEPALEAPGPPRAEVHAPLAPTVGEPPLVDRIEVLEVLHTFVEDVLEGKSGAQFLTGEPGIGKSRLVRETIDYAHRRGVRTLQAQCADLSGTGAYAPWIEILGRVVREETPESLRRYCGLLGSELAKASGELKAKVGSLPRLPSGNATEERLRFLETFAEFFRAMARDSPVLLILEDIASADPDSLRLLRYVIGRCAGSRLGVLATYPELDLAQPSSLADCLNALHRDRLLRSHRLNRLEPESVSKLMQGILGDTQAPPPEVLRIMVEKTGGNPFFVEEVVRDLIESKTWVVGRTVWDVETLGSFRLPPTVRAVIERRLQQLDEGTNALLRVASVLGLEFDVEVLRRVLAITPEELAARIEVGLKFGLLGEERRQIGRIVGRFRDNQIRETLYTAISLVRRRTLHASAAEVIEDLYRATLEGHSEELARHYAGANESARAFEYADRAARRAMDVYAYEDAARLLASALDYAGSEAPPRVRGDLLERLADASVSQGHLEPATDCYRDAATIYRGLGERRRSATLLARAALASWDLAAEEYGRFLPLFESARSEFPRRDRSPELARFLARASIAFAWFGDPGRGRRMARQAIALAKAHRLPEMEMTAITGLGLTIPCRERARGVSCVGQWRRMMAHRPASIAMQITGDEFASAAWLELSGRGDWRSAVRLLEKAREAARSARFFERVAYLQYVLSGFYFEAGRADLGRASIREVEELVRAHSFSEYYLDAISNQQFFEGEFRAAEERTLRIVEEIQHSSPHHRSFIGLYEFLGRIAAAQGRTEEAVEYFEQCRETARFHGYPLEAARHLLVALEGLVEAHLRQKRLAAASRVSRDLTSLSLQLPHRIAQGFALRAQGLYAEELGSAASALRALEAAARAWRRADWRFWWGIALCDVGRIRRDLGEPEKAHRSLTHARALFHEMQLPPWIAVVDATMVGEPPPNGVIPA